MLWLILPKLAMNILKQFNKSMNQNPKTETYTKSFYCRILCNIIDIRYIYKCVPLYINNDELKN